MPTYDFECRNCGYTWDDLCRKEDPPAPCPICEDRSVVRLFPVVAALRTDSDYQRGHRTLRDQFRSQEQFDMVLSAAKASGYTPQTSDRYEPGLARYTGDPRGFVPSTNSRGHVMALAEENDLSLDGPSNLKRQARLNREPAKVPLSDSLVEEVARLSIAADPALGEVGKQEIREEMIRRHGSKQ